MHVRSLSDDPISEVQAAPFPRVSGRIGHLWQNRFLACVLAPDHLWAALAYVERNTVRAGMVGRAGDYAWSSAVAHMTAQDPRAA